MEPVHGPLVQTMGTMVGMMEDSSMTEPMSGHAGHMRRRVHGIRHEDIIGIADRLILNPLNLTRRF
ncbi:MAG: hypothetical protein AAB797_00500 [Patescibacteria group bacterium]